MPLYQRIQNNHYILSVNLFKLHPVCLLVNDSVCGAAFLTTPPGFTEAKS